MTDTVSQAVAPVVAPSSDSEIQEFEAILTCQTAPEMRERLLALDWNQFERFVKYVFECAGYSVKHRGSDHHRHHVDLELYERSDMTGPPVALVEVRHYRVASLRHQSVAAFLGNIALTGTKRGYLVTTSTFTAPAQDAARQAKSQGYDICLTDWRHLARYLTYLHGSRVTGSDGRKHTARPTPPDWLHQADATPHREPSVTRILAVSNNRGGVAKTTSTLSLALALVATGKRVLLVDLDGQANLTLALPPPAPRRGQPVPIRRTIVEFFAGNAEMGELVQPTRRERLWLLPGDSELYTRDNGGGAHPEAELRFVHALHTLEVPTSIVGAGRFDWIIMDTPPAQSSYTRAALAAAHVIVLPTIIEPFAAFSIGRLIDTARAMHGLMGRDGRILGSFGVRWPQRPSLQLRSELATLRTKLHGRDEVALLNTLIPEDTRIAQANKKMVEGGVSGIFAYQRSPAAKAYRDLLSELESKVK